MVMNHVPVNELPYCGPVKNRPLDTPGYRRHDNAI